MFYSLLAIAIAPGIAISLYIYFMDKHEKEPAWLLAICFFYGILAVFLTLVLSIPVNALVPDLQHQLWGPLVHAFMEVALVEEGCKYVFLLFLVYPRKDFNEPFDGIVYAVMIGMGFATLENILYSFQHGFSVAFMRMFTSVPAHGVFAVLMGYYMGLAKIRHRNKLFSIIGLLAATVFHGLYDYFIFISHLPGMLLAALLALGLGIYLSLKAIRSHSDASPFKKKISA